MKKEIECPDCPVLDIRELPDGNVTFTFDGDFLRKYVPLFGGKITADLTNMEVFDKLVKFQTNYIKKTPEQIKLKEQLSSIEELLKKDIKKALVVIKRVCWKCGLEALSIEPVKSLFEEIIRERRGGNHKRKNISNQIIGAIYKSKDIDFDLQKWRQLEMFFKEEKQKAEKVFEIVKKYCKDDCPYKRCDYGIKNRCRKLVKHVKTTNDETLTIREIKDILEHNNPSEHTRKAIRVEFKLPTQALTNDIHTLLNQTIVIEPTENSPHTTS